MSTELKLAKEFRYDPDLRNIVINGEPFPYHLSADTPVVYQPGGGQEWGILLMPVVVDDFDQFEYDPTEELALLREAELELAPDPERSRKIGVALAFGIPILALLTIMIVLGVAFR